MGLVYLNTYNQDIAYSLKPPMPGWRWNVTITPPSKDTTGSKWEDLIVENITLPNGENINADSSFGAGRTSFYPEFPNISSVAISFYESDDGAASTALGRWFSAVLDQDGFYGLPVEYKATLNATLFGYSSNTQPVLQYTLSGVWPSEAGSFSLAYNSSERLILTGTLSCDRFSVASRTDGA